MKKVLSALCIMFFLTSCTNDAARNTPEQLFAFWESMQNVSADMYVRAEYPDYAVDFRMNCIFSDGTCCVTISEPAEIRDVTVRVDADGISLEYDGITLEAGSGKFSPATMFAELVRIWKYGYIAEYSALQTDGVKCISAVYTDGEYEYRTVFSKDFKPISAEIYERGSLIAACELTNVNFGETVLSE